MTSLIQEVTGKFSWKESTYQGDDISDRGQADNKETSVLQGGV